ncbi:hypothetical protein ES288_D06G000600v1 [Gossypium darwinii]|uniref:Uncharacterized protein n=1 Tax=Gossypium darwinii TaxID=34276 RepID=A0A5D2C2X4_GOSDA|nr:hypothetical protein ES288_D06G000600v1 [Gossypium darwinii]
MHKNEGFSFVDVGHSYQPKNVAYGLLDEDIFQSLLH